MRAFATPVEGTDARRIEAGGEVEGPMLPSFVPSSLGSNSQSWQRLTDGRITIGVSKKFRPRGQANEYNHPLSRLRGKDPLAHQVQHPRP